MAEVDPQIADVLTFWFGAPGDDDYGTFRKAWFQKNPAFDREIETRFAPLMAEALAGDRDAWMETVEGSLALLLLLDQFPRNVYRNTPQAFASDAKARSVADIALTQGQDRTVLPVQRGFFYLPFEHSEDLADQERSVALFTDLGTADMLKYAVAHKDIIQRFGRFPHRNAILGRDSTPEEVEFLKQPGSSF